MIGNDELNKIIKDCEAVGYKITVRDISYVFLCRLFLDSDVAYKSIFGTNSSNSDEYSNDKKVSFLRSYIDSNYPIKEKKVKSNHANHPSEDITFEENKAEIIKLIKETQTALEKKMIEPKDALKIQADLRVKLNDKFSVKDENHEQLIYVNCKFNSICECGRELYIPTKEDLMEQYNLIEKK